MCRIFMKTREGLGKTDGDEFVVDVRPAGGEVDNRDDGLEVSLLDSFGEDEEEEVAQLIDIIARLGVAWPTGRTNGGRPQSSRARCLAWRGKSEEEGDGGGAVGKKGEEG